MMRDRLRTRFLAAMGLPALLATTACPAPKAAPEGDASVPSGVEPRVTIPVGALSAGTLLASAPDASTRPPHLANTTVTCETEPKSVARDKAAPSPFERCLDSISGFNRSGEFNAPETDVKRRTDPTACCYDTTIQNARGRPLRGESGSVVAASRARGDWSSEIEEIDITRLTEKGRDERAQHWLREAAAEHASVASFARFSLHLASLGAPPTLLEEAHAAAIDEIEHARVCYAIASAYGGEQKGPAPLDLSGVRLGTPTLAELAVETFIDGCVGETIAAAEAHEGAATETEHVVRRALSAIARDEEQHAELAWRTLAWALKTGGVPVREALRGALAGVRANAAQRNPATQSTLCAIVFPCADALLAAHA